MKGEREMSNQVYGYITDKIMEQLERGCVPWHKPWKSPDGGRVPMNYASKKPYRGVNTFLLAVSGFKAGYDCNYWMAFKQIQALGGNVRGSTVKWLCSGNCWKNRPRIARQTARLKIRAPISVQNLQRTSAASVRSSLPQDRRSNSSD